MAYQWDSFREPRTPEQDRQSEGKLVASTTSDDFTFNQKAERIQLMTAYTTA